MTNDITDDFNKVHLEWDLDDLSHLQLLRSNVI